MFVGYNPFIFLGRTLSFMKNKIITLETVIIYNNNSTLISIYTIFEKHNTFYLQCISAFLSNAETRSINVYWENSKVRR